MLEFLRWTLHDMGEVREGVKIDLRSDEQRFFDCVLYSRINSTSTEVHIVMEFKRLGAGFLRNKSYALKKLTDNAKETNARYVVLTRFDETAIYDAKTGSAR
jgi:hypothetical protein